MVIHVYKQKNIYFLGEEEESLSHKNNTRYNIAFCILTHPIRSSEQSPYRAWGPTPDHSQGHVPRLWGFVGFIVFPESPPFPESGYVCVPCGHGSPSPVHLCLSCSIRTDLHHGWIVPPTSGASRAHLI